jgi:formylglycine-generating enzyme required for sulfatase activity
MELADGSLQERFQEWRQRGWPGIPAEELLTYFAEAAEALDFLGGAKLVHRDIKPQNLLHVKGHAKVADFGIARTQVNEVDQTMNPGGTPSYMPPEAWGGRISTHSDQYSFAITWYEMRTGRPPFPSKNLPELSRQHLYEIPDLSEVPPPEQQVLLRALAKNPDERFPSCTQFVQALREAIAPPPPPADSHGCGILAALGSFALVLIAVLVAVVLWRIPSPPPPPATSAVAPSNVPSAVVSWKPPGWEPEAAETEIVEVQERRYYKRLVRTVGQQRVVLVLVPRKSAQDPQTFYLMENKVWNDLYATFMADPKAPELFAKYRNRPGCEVLVSLPGRRQVPDWRKGGISRDFPDPKGAQFLGVEGDWGEFKKGALPVFRVKVTEAHCFAEWLGGKLPTRLEWLHAAGKDEAQLPGPFDAEANKEELAVGLFGPRPVSWGKSHVSIYGCRQMAGNGYEWTRDLYDPHGKEEIPLEEIRLAPKVVIVGQSYTKREPLLFKDMAPPLFFSSSESQYDIGFRVVVEQETP